MKLNGSEAIRKSGVKSYNGIHNYLDNLLQTLYGKLLMLCL